MTSKRPASCDAGRRALLKAGGLLGACAAAGGWDRTSAWAASEERAPRVPAFEFEGATLTQLAERVRTGQLAARTLAEAYLARIEALDRQGPALRAVIEVNPDALQLAAELDVERRERGARGALHGLPILIKDNIDSADRMRTSAGSLALAESIAPRDAGVVARLRASGALLLGKTNLSEWANFRSTRSTSGWSGRGGLTRNPYVLDRNPCGSSSGSGAAAAAELCAAAVGTETDGSIVCPATANGLVGLKPTVGLVSRAGIIPIAASQDTAGPMTRCVADAALLLGVLAGEDARDPATALARGRVESDYTRFLDPRGLRGARLGVARKLAGFHPQVDRLFDNALEDLRRAGATIVDEAEVPHLRDYDESEFEVLLYEFKAGLEAYLAGLSPRAGVRTLAELIAFNERERARELQHFGQELLLQAQLKGPLTSRAYRDALARNRRLSRREGLDALLDGRRLDAVLAPTGGPAWTTDLVNGDHFVGGGAATPAAVAGYPHLTVPMGFVAGLPVGLSFLGRAWSEPLLLKLGYAYEQATGHRRPPRFLPSLGLDGPGPGTPLATGAAGRRRGCACA